jgi:hypothetical protein
MKSLVICFAFAALLSGLAAARHRFKLAESESGGQRWLFTLAAGRTPPARSSPAGSDLGSHGQVPCPPALLVPYERIDGLDCPLGWITPGGRRFVG